MSSDLRKCCTHSLSLPVSSLLLPPHTHAHSGHKPFFIHTRLKAREWLGNKQAHYLRRPEFRPQHTDQWLSRVYNSRGSKASSLLGYMHSHAQTYKRVIKNNKNKSWDWGDGSAWAALQKTQVIFSALTWQLTQLSVISL